MPDKNFDKLFKDSFMDAEIEPSADLWGNIVQQLEPKKKRSFPVMWIAAASVVVVASVMLATQNNEKVQLRGTIAEVAAVNSTDELRSLAAVAKEETSEVIQEVTPEPKVVTHTLLKRETVKATSSPVDDAQKNMIASVQPSEENEHLVIKRGEVKPFDVTPALGNATQNQTMYAQADTKPVDYFEQAEETDSGKKGIRNVGDLINYVVDKVDKREKKLIKFDTDDDDNSSIIGLNIGFLKLNKKNK